MSEEQKEEGFKINAATAIETVKGYYSDTKKSVDESWQAAKGWLSITAILLILGLVYYQGSEVTDAVRLTMYQTQAEELLNHHVSEKTLKDWQKTTYPTLEAIKARNPELASRKQYHAAYQLADMWYITYKAKTLFR